MRVSKRMMCAAAALVLGALVGGGCGAGGPPYDLRIQGSGLTNNADLHVGLVQADGTKLIDNEWFPLQGDSISGTYGNILAQGASYDVFLYLDSNGNGVCDAPPVDMMWKVRLGPVQGGATIGLNQLALEPAACDFFDR